RRRYRGGAHRGPRREIEDVEAGHRQLAPSLPHLEVLGGEAAHRLAVAHHLHRHLDGEHLGGAGKGGRRLRRLLLRDLSTCGRGKDDDEEKDCRGGPVWPPCCCRDGPAWPCPMWPPCLRRREIPPVPSTPNRAATQGRPYNEDHLSGSRGFPPPRRRRRRGRGWSAPCPRRRSPSPAARTRPAAAPAAGRWRRPAAGRCRPPPCRSA